MEECVRFARQCGYGKISLWTNDVLTAARATIKRRGDALRPVHRTDVPNARRVALPEHPRLGPNWDWWCAPLSEWDGVARTDGGLGD